MSSKSVAAASIECFFTSWSSIWTGEVSIGDDERYQHSLVCRNRTHKLKRSGSAAPSTIHRCSYNAGEESSVCLGALGHTVDERSDDLTLFLQLMKATLAVFADVYSQRQLLSHRCTCPKHLVACDHGVFL